ncbi:MAG: MBL fold metallo-hydrolase [Thermoplasmatota archaeon]
MEFRRLKLGHMANFSYAFGDAAGSAIVDPAWELPRLLDAARAIGPVTHILLTHGHRDHVQLAEAARDATGAKLVAHRASALPVELRVDDGDAFRVGGIEVRAVATPGHQPDSVCYIVDDEKLLTGDTLFIGECGRTDLAGSDPGAQRDSLLVKLAALPRSLEVCPGHDYGKTPTATLASEFETNYTLRPRTKEEFVRFMLEP